MLSYDVFAIERALKDLISRCGNEDIAKNRIRYIHETFNIEFDHLEEEIYLPEYVINEAIKANSTLIDCAMPVLAELQQIVDMVSTDYVITINDSSGVILGFIDRSVKKTMMLGGRCSELKDSSYAVACALRSGLVAEVSGYELIYGLPGSENWRSTSSAVTAADGSVLGVLTLMNFCGKCSPIVQIVSLGASIIEAKLRGSLPDTAQQRNASCSPELECFSNLIGDSEIMNNQKKFAHRAAKTLCTVLIEGESGTGKELMAHAIHCESRPEGPFIALNCGALPMELIQSELFGYEHGAFTGALRGGMPGKFELADTGTLFLDEIGEMPLSMQVNFLRALEDKTITRIGGSQAKRVDVRIIAATNRNLWESVKNGKFRKDLFYRLNVFQLRMPALRNHREDIPQIARHSLKALCERYKRAPMYLDDVAMELLMAHDWPGNVRELKNTLERAVICADGDVITAQTLSMVIESGVAPPPPQYSGSLKSIESLAIKDCLHKNDFNISRSAEELGITRPTLHRKIRDYNLEPSMIKAENPGFLEHQGRGARE